MISTRRGDVYLPLLTVVLDAVAIETAFILSYWLRFRSTLFDRLGFVSENAPPFRGYLLASVVVMGIWLLLFHSRKMYGLRRNVNLSDELISVARVVSIGMLLVMSAAFLYREFSYSRIVFGLLWGLSIGFVYTGRAVVRSFERRLHRKGLHLQEAVVLGNDDLADQVYRRLHMHPSFGISIRGYFGERPADGDLAIARATYLGGIATAPKYLQEESVRLAFIALRSRDHPQLFELLGECEGVNIEFMMVPDVLEVLTSQVQLRDLEGIPFLTLKNIPMTIWGIITKRTFDLLLSMLGLLLLSPVLIIIALLVKLDSRGPVLFKQTRVGLDGNEFTMLKFRSMVQGAERSDREAGLGIPGDPRRTRLGRILRKTSLDELPQLWNVLTGDMSLVGPRPERTHVVRGLSGAVPKYLDRHRVKTGVTGWAQVNGLRGDTSIQERIKYDLYYIENWSLAFDIRIVLRTIRGAFISREDD
jgi:exopolysaccharide biosynthesis polyprenyl glycosylphosphotransferase